jgi:putrescine transport system ATP-binding protein
VELESGKVIVANLSSLLLTQTDAPSYDDEVYVCWSENSQVVLTS